VSTAESAWAAVVLACGIGPRDLAHAPVGASEHLERAILATGARLMAIDLDPSSGAPVWPDETAASQRGRTVRILDHRFGRPIPPPRMPDQGVLLEEATGAIGGAAGGRAVGSLGRASVVTLGASPFDRSRGALMATNAADLASRLRATVDAVPVAPRGSALDGVAAAPWGGLEDDAGGLEDHIDACRAAAGVYDSAFRPLNLPMSVLAPHPETVPTYAAYLVQTQDPDALIHALARRGVEARRALDTRLSSGLEAGPKTAWPGARHFYSRTVVLPCHPNLGLDELLYVADAVRQHLQGLPARP